MADLTASDVTVTIRGRVIAGNRKRVYVKLQFGDGAKTYPAGGIPLPGIGSFGLSRFQDALVIYDADDASGLLWKYDSENRKLRGYWPTGGSGTAPTNAATDPSVSVPSGATTVTSSAAQPDLVEAPGQAREFVGNTTVIPQQTLYAIAEGW